MNPELTALHSSLVTRHSPLVTPIGLLPAAAASRSSLPRRPGSWGSRSCASASATRRAPELADLRRSLLLGRPRPAGPHDPLLQARRASGKWSWPARFTRSAMHTPWRLLRFLPDWRTLRFWYGRSRPDNRDDTLLLGVIAEFAGDGLVFQSALDLCPELLVQARSPHPPPPDVSEETDIAFGWELAKEMGRLDVGQSVAVKERAVLAVEAIEGTDRAIAGPASCAGRAALSSSRWPSRSRTCVLTCHGWLLDHRDDAPSRRPGPGHRSRQDHRHRPGGDGGPGGPLRHLDCRPLART